MWYFFIANIIYTKYYTISKSELVAQKLTRLMRLSRCATTINDLCVDFAKLHVCCKMFKKIKSNVYVTKSL